MTHNIIERTTISTTRCGNRQMQTAEWKGIRVDHGEVTQCTFKMKKQKIIPNNRQPVKALPKKHPEQQKLKACFMGNDVAMWIGEDERKKANV